MSHVDYALAGKPSVPRPATRRTAQSAVAAMLSLLVVVFMAGAGWLLWQSYRQAEDSIRLKATAFSSVVAANVEWVTATARQVLRRVDDSIGPNLSSLQDSEVDKLRDAVAALPGGARVYVVKADGETVLTTDGEFQAIDIRDRDYFKVPAAGEDWYISSLLVSRLNGEQIFAISKRLERANEFVGVAVISFGLPLIETIWASLALDDDSTVSLFRDDGQLVLRYPAAEGPIDLSDYILFTDLLRNADIGVYNAVSPADGISRVVGYRRVPGTNLVALASQSTDGAFEEFIRGALATTLVLVPVAAALVILSVWITRLLQRDAKREAELTEALERNQMMLREVHHRVKNNLQSVVALLRMQHLPPEVANDTIARVHSMSSLHEHIYQTDQFGDVEASAFLKGIVEGSVKVYGSSATVKFDLVEFVIDRDRAMGLGLVVTEVVSNACKYGAAADGSVTLEVSLKSENAESGVLVIKDSGPGFDRTTGRRGMGTKLIHSFAASLGSFEYTYNDGTIFTLRISRR
jgi:two-component system, sensor histidine kinase PdtaS